MTTLLLLRRTVQVAVPAAVALLCFAQLWNPLLEPLGQPPLDVLAYVLSGSLFAIAGLVAWSLRPANRVGLMMMIVGFGVLIGAAPQAGIQQPTPLAQLIDWNLLYQFAPPGPGQAPATAYPSGWGPLWADLFMAFGPIWSVLLLQLLLSFPEGRLGSRLSRALVVSLYVLVPLIGYFESPDLPPDVPVPFPIALVLGKVVYFASLVFGFVLILRRWVLGGRARRRSLSPLLWSLFPIALVFSVPTVVTLWSMFVGKPRFGSLTVLVWNLNLSSPIFLIALPVGILIGLMRSGLDMTTVGSLVVRLSDGLLPEQLQPALAEVLHDPSLEVAYWVPALESYADLQGTRVQLPAADGERAVSVLGDKTSPVAALVYDSSLRLEPQLLDTASAAVRMALENARLQVQLRAQLEEVRQSRARLVETALKERQRVERDLHDGAQQQLVTLLLSLQVTKAEATKHSDPQTAALVEANIASLKQALSELRELARGIHPSILTEAGLVPAIRSLAERSPLPVEVKGGVGEGRLAQQLEATLYFVAAEAITNAVKHSHGEHICLALQRRPGTVTLDVTDDGQGGADLSKGTGLRGLSDRVAAVGGRLHVESNHGGGTKIHSEIPCA